MTDLEWIELGWPQFTRWEIVKRRFCEVAGLPVVPILKFQRGMYETDDEFRRRIKERLESKQDKRTELPLR